MSDIAADYPTLLIDFETYSKTNLKKAGVYRYAEDADILLCAFALDGGPVRVWDAYNKPEMPAPLYAALAERNRRIVAHNALFDRTIMRLAKNTPDVMKAAGRDIERWRCTMVQAYAHALPGTLDVLCEVFRMPQDQRKLKSGRELIHLFCKPRPKNHKLHRATPVTHKLEWQQFIAYAKSDIDSMRELYYNRLPRWNYPDNDKELALWHLDQAINDRGFRVDLELVRAAIATVNDAQKDLAQRTHELTEGEVSSATQRDKLLVHLLETHDVSLPDMKADTIARRKNDPELPAAVRELLEIRAQASSTSTAKYEKLLAATSTDGRMRGTLQFSGAGRTARWAGRNFQPQNLPRPTLKGDQVEKGISDMKDGIAHLIWPEPMKLASSAVRGVLVAPAGRKLVVSDLSNIEGRAVAWLAGEEWKLQAFRDFDAGRGPDLYKVAYGRSFAVDPGSISDKGEERQIGKVQELGLGYGGGAGAFATFASTYNMDLEHLADVGEREIDETTLLEAERFYYWMLEMGNPAARELGERVFVVCEALKRLWREAHPGIVALWREVENKTWAAVQTPGRTFRYRALAFRRDGAWLRIRLPSGRYLCYPQPRIESRRKNGQESEQITYLGLNQYTRQWQRISTYGGKLVENIAQAVARDVLAHAMPRAENAGYATVLTVHDELVTEADDVSGYSVKGLSDVLASGPAWANGLPLAADGFETYRYKKG